MYALYMFLLTMILAFAPRTDTYEFTIQKDLRDGMTLAEDEWTKVQVTGICDDRPDKSVHVNVQLKADVAQRKPNISIFLANDAHNIFRIDFEEKIKYVLYKFPYKVERIFDQQQLSSASPRMETRFCYFPRKWLPKNISKISGALRFANDVTYNYYGIRNYKISIPDLMVVEEYRNLKCGTGASALVHGDVHDTLSSGEIFSY